MTATHRSAEKHARRMLGRSYLTPDPLTAAFQRAGRMAHAEARSQLSLGGGYVGFWRRWVWSVDDVATGEHLATGRALTGRGFENRRYAAYLRELDRIAREAQRERDRIAADRRAES